MRDVIMNTLGSLRDKKDEDIGEEPDLEGGNLLVSPGSEKGSDGQCNVVFRKGSKQKKERDENGSSLNLEIDNKYLDEGSHESSDFAPLEENSADDIREMRARSSTGSLSSMSASINLANSIIGSGVLGLSYVGAQSGILTYLIFQLAAATVAIITCMLLVRCTEKGGTTLESIGEAAFGLRGIRLCALSVCCQGMGSMLSYITIIGDVFPRLYAQWEKHSPDEDIDARAAEIRVRCMILITVFVILPFTFAPSVDMLKYSSTFAVAVFIIFTLSSCLLWFIEPVSADAGDIHLFHVNTNVLSNLPATLFATNSHHVILSIYHELRVQNPRTMLRVIARGYAFVVFIYITVAVSGYCLYRGNTLPNLIDNFPQSPWVQALRTAMLFAIVLGFPNIHWAVRRSILSCILGTRYRFEWKTHIGAALAIVTVALLMGIVIPDLSIVLKFVGCTASAWLILGLPSLLALRLGIGSKFPKYFFMGLGSFICICGLTFSTIDLIGREQQDTIIIPPSNEHIVVKEDENLW